MSGRLRAPTVAGAPEVTAITPRLLTAAEFHRLADVPPEVEWFANLSNPSTRRAYANALRNFMRFTGIVRPEEFRTVTRAHIIAWRDDLARRGLGGSTIRTGWRRSPRKNAVTHNPVKGVERPRTESGEGKTPALGDHQARKLLDAPSDETIKSKRDRAILSTLRFHALRARSYASSRTLSRRNRPSTFELTFMRSMKRIDGYGGTSVLPDAPLVGALSAQLRRPRPRSATSAQRRFPPSAAGHLRSFASPPHAS